MTDPKVVLLHPGNHTHPITEVWAVIDTDQAGNNGLVAAMSPIGSMPLLVTSERLVPMIVEKAEFIARATGRTFTLAHFTNRTDLQTIGGN